MIQRKLTNIRQSDEEAVKAAGMVLDFDEIARRGGAMSREETMLAKAYGVYSSRQRGDHMLRITNPGGVMTSAQARGIAIVAEKYARGLVSWTTRQSVQLHKVELKDIPVVLRELAKYNLSTFHGCGDNLRNVAACPWASNCPHRRFDVLPFAQETARVINSYRDLDNLPRKFKITFSGCGGDCGQPHMNCVGVVALVRKKKDGSVEEGFRVLIGGGMGWKAFVAKELFSFVPKDRIIQVCRAIGLLFRDHGDRFNRALARLKFVVDRLGIERCREIVLENLAAESVETRALDTKPVRDCGPAVPERPLAEAVPLGTDGRAIQPIMVPKGEISSQDLTRVAELSEIFGDKHVHSSNRQNLEIHGVETKNLPALRAELAKVGFVTAGFFGLNDIVPCVGTTYCPLAVSTTRNLYDLLIPIVKKKKYDKIRNKVIINITGCPNSCSPYRISDIGFRGMRIREHTGSVEAYQVLIGGTESDYGKFFSELKVADCVRAVESILGTFIRLRRDDETLAVNVRRVGVEPYLEDWDA